jgi:hypothetical protein
MRKSKPTRAAPILRIAAILFSATLPGLMRAQALTDVGDFVSDLGTENAILTGDLTLNSSHTDSGVAAGTSATIENGSNVNQMSDYHDDPYAFRDDGSLTIVGGESQTLAGGATVVSNASVNNGLKYFPTNGGTQGALTYGSSSSSMPQIFFDGNGGSPTVTLPSSVSGDTYFSSRSTLLTAAASNLAGLSGQTAVTASGGSVTLNGSAGQVKVFNWDVATVGAVNAITLNATAGEVVVINVHDLPSGTTWTPSVNFNGSSQADSVRVLWNLVGGINLNTGSGMWDGSILGIGSTVTSMQGVNGQVFAKSLEMSNGSELHFDPLVAIPEPPYAALMAGLAVCGAAAIVRRCTLLNRFG